jgi:transcriptional regulator with XRE-family HTH domain
MILMRTEMGDILRDYRTERKMTLRTVALKASISPAYLSEVERGQNEVSSELLVAIVDALDVPLSRMLMEVADRLALFEEYTPSTPIPDSIPDDFFSGMGR